MYFFDYFVTLWAVIRLMCENIKFIINKRNNNMKMKSCLAGLTIRSPE
jgi:hypothetical protein